MAVVARILPEAGWGIKPVAAGSAQPRPSLEGRCIPRFQVYRMSAQTDRLLVWRSIRCDAQGSTYAQHAGVENVSRSFHAHREPQQSTHLGPAHNKSLFHGPRTEPVYCGSPPFGVVSARQLLPRRLS
jgi:hypothetical protein